MNERQRKKSLRNSIIDGSFYSSMVGFGEQFFSTFALFLQASAFQLGLLGSIPQLVGSLAQLATRRVMIFFKSRKRFTVTCALLQASMHIPIALCFFFDALSVPLLIGFVSIYFLLAMLPGPAWNSWMGDLVEDSKKGRYYGLRNTVCAACSFIAYILAGYLLQEFSDHQLKYLGFTILFCLAFISRLWSAFFLFQIHEPEYKVTSQKHESFATFLRHTGKTNYGFFAMFLWLMNFGVFVQGPFLVAYLLEDVHITYFQLALVSASAILTKVAVMPAWGKAADKFGMRKMLILSGLLMTLIPLLWLVSEDFSWLIFAQVYSGFAWAGFEIASFSFFFDLTTHKNRTTSIAYYNVVNGFMLISGAIVGAWLLSINTPWSTYFTIFVASAVLRFLSVALFLRRVREPRSVKSVGYRSLLFRELMYKPVRYTTLNIMSHIHTKVLPSTMLPVQNVLSQTKNVADSLMQPFEQTLGSAQSKIKSNIKTYKRKF